MTYPRKQYRISWSWEEHRQDPLSRKPRWFIMAEYQKPEDYMSEPAPQEAIERTARTRLREIEFNLGETCRDALASIEVRVEYDAEHQSAWSELCSMRVDSPTEFLDGDEGLHHVYAMRDKLAKMGAGTGGPTAGKYAGITLEPDPPNDPDLTQLRR